jgi:hypothetical protein
MAHPTGTRTSDAQVAAGRYRASSRLVAASLAPPNDRSGIILADIEQGDEHYWGNNSLQSNLRSIYRQNAQFVLLTMLPVGFTRFENRHDASIAGAIALADDISLNGR